MKKALFLFFILFGCLLTARADHITGGQMYYNYVGTDPDGQLRFEITLKLFMRCNSGRQFNNPTIIAVFDKVTSQRVQQHSVSLAQTQTIRLTTPDPCITDPPEVCYEVGYYFMSLTIPPNSGGYIISSQVNYRINNISNLVLGYSNIGATYTAEIPGSALLPNAYVNNSANFTGDDLVIVCAENFFEYDFQAVDADGDSLVYYFCEAYQTGNSGGLSTPPPAPPYSSVPYGNGFYGSAPLGTEVQIDPATGTISGVAPPSGVYVVTVCVQEIRNGVVIATQRKDLQIFIAPCTVASALLQKEYILCDTTTTIYLQNLSTSPLINSYSWRIRNRTGSLLYASTSAEVSYSFPDTGIYNISLVINPGQDCSDSTNAKALVYPGFKPGLDVTGTCITRPSNFTDLTTSVYGTVNSWSWDFGEEPLSTDTSTLRNPTYTYPVTGNKNVRLTVTDTRGCKATIERTIGVYDKPPITLLFRDTLICTPDAVQLGASGIGSFTWTPTGNMTNEGTATPTVSPPATTTYYVELNDNGCINTDSVKVRVVDHVTLSAMMDTTICQGDTIQLRVSSDGFRYAWTPAAQLIDPNVKNPFAITGANTVYRVTAYIGSCFATDDVSVLTVPYPSVDAGNDTTLCFGTSAQLNGSSNGVTYLWSPAATLTAANTLRTVARPLVTTSYVLSAFDTRGCPKAGRDTVVVNVMPEILAFAGRDTSIVLGQRLQLNASGGSGYSWSPATGLSNVNVPDPLAVLNSPSEGIRYRVIVFNEEGCLDSAFITVRVFNTKPMIFVPTGFTPNGDGKNDYLKPVMAGMKEVEYFKVYNRWGQLVHSSSLSGPGWDGRVNGQPQPSSTFVWVVKATDYTGTAYFQKGVVTLIR